MLTPIEAARRSEIAAGPSDPATYAGLVTELSLDRVDASPGELIPLAGGELRAIAWNTERCKFLQQSADLLRDLEPDVVLLTEMDWGMARSGQAHTTRKLAEKLDMFFAFGVEFLELGHGNAQERSDHANKPIAVGFHGNALLCKVPLRDPEVVRLDEGGQRFDGARGERRVGGRMAVVATLPTARGEITLASVHLESHSDPPQRGAQIRTLLDAIERRAPRAPALIAGDLNTFSMSVDELSDGELLRSAMRDDPDRRLYPQRFEPLFDHARAAGFDWEACNLPGEPTGRFADEGSSWRGGFKIDWFLTRGLQVREPAVIDAAEPGGCPLSDHELIALSVSL